MNMIQMFLVAKDHIVTIIERLGLTPNCIGSGFGVRKPPCPPVPPKVFVVPGVRIMLPIVGAGKRGDDIVFFKDPENDPGQGAEFVADDIKNDSFFDVDANQFPTFLPARRSRREGFQTLPYLIIKKAPEVIRNESE